MPNLPMPEGLTDVDLECVMLDVPTIEVRDLLYGVVGDEDYFYGDIPELKYAQGPVAENTAHVTLLFGIHPSESYAEDVDEALFTWMPQPLLIEGADFFPSSIEGQDYNVLILKVAKTSNLLTAHNLLTELPHTSSYTEYKPHISLAYINGDVDIQKCVDRINLYFERKIIYPAGINLGLDD